MNIRVISRFMLTVLPFIVLCRSVDKTSLQKSERGKQFALPFVALVYMIFTMFQTDKIYTGTVRVVTLIGSYASRFFPGLGTLIPSTFSALRLDQGKSAILNYGLVVGYIAFKRIIIKSLKKIWDKESVAEKTTAIFYDYDEETGKWFVKDELANARIYIKGFYFAIIGVSAVLFYLSSAFRSSPFFAGAFYPAVGIIFLGEIVSFMDGFTKGEYFNEFMGEDDISTRVCNYGMLVRILDDLFDERVLASRSASQSIDLTDDFDTLEEMVESDDKLVATMGEYYKTLRQSGDKIDINYVKSTVSMMAGHSNLFSNPFYKDMRLYLPPVMTRTLMAYGKCLVIAGRDSYHQDVLDWINETIVEYVGTDSLWRTGVLSEKKPDEDIDIGILRFSDLYNQRVHNVNKDFISNVKFVFLIEPSRIISSGQIGLSIVVSEFKNPDDVVYCAMDRNCDGLVDSLSHLLKTTFTTVTATLAGAQNVSEMYWKADGDYMHHRILPNISRYLGVGTELNTVAMKYQVEKTTWTSSEKFPVDDMKWIDGQYYKQISGYTDIPATQEAFNRSFGVTSDVWGLDVDKNRYLTVEDEFQNLFEMPRLYASRAEEQLFINTISENYLLRDYMIDNSGIFRNDPKFIPTIVPDYARTERNVIMKLLIQMADAGVSERTIEKELMLCGIGFDEENPMVKVEELIKKHCGIEKTIYDVRFVQELNANNEREIIRYYTVRDNNELSNYVASLKNAYFITENEQGEKDYLTAKLYGQVFQSHLPGQFLTYGGKYYQVETITPDNGVVLRRAADHINERHYYRQLRSIDVTGFVPSEDMGKIRNERGIEYSLGFANINVSTSGYIDMKEYGDIRNGQKVLLNNVPDRKYHNKSVLKIKFVDIVNSFPEKHGEILYTVTLLMNELFRTVFPSNHQFICALSSFVNESPVGDMSYRITGDIEEGCIYIVEDCEIDMGLIESVDRYFNRFMEIINDYIVWHLEKMQEKKYEEIPDENEMAPDFTELNTYLEEKKKKNSLWNRIKGIFTRKKKPKKKDLEAENVETSTMNSSETIPMEASVNEEPLAEEAFEEVVETNEALQETEDVLETDASEAETVEEAVEVLEETTESLEDEEEVVETLSEADKEELVEEADVSIEPLEEETEIEDESDDTTMNLMKVLVEGPTDYQLFHFLKFGFAEVDEHINFIDTLDFLKGYNYNNNPLFELRESIKRGDAQENVEVNKEGSHYCDFCGRELLGGEYDVLHDGRERCIRCSRSVVKTEKEFIEIYRAVQKNMEAFFGIQIKTGIKISMVAPSKIAKVTGQPIVTTAGFDGRAVGLAVESKDGYELYIESGLPKLMAIRTIAHELTHIWQYLNWDKKEIEKQYGKGTSLAIYEGMATWVAIQYLYLINENAYAKRHEATEIMREDEYGIGLKLYLKKYPISSNTFTKNTPFMSKMPL